jgi:hypothetical protein
VDYYENETGGPGGRLSPWNWNRRSLTTPLNPFTGVTVILSSLWQSSDYFFADFAIFARLGARF